MTGFNPLVVLLGSDDFPLMPPSFSKGAFAASARAFKDYLKATTGLGLPNSRVLDLFGSEDPIERQDACITKLLVDHKIDADAVIIYYVGHGGFLSDRQYFLAVKTTDPSRKHFTGLKIRDLAETLKNNASGKKIYIILDCCFAGAAVETFQGDEVSTMVEQQTYDSFPALGTALLAASSRNEPAIAPDGGTYTMMAEALLFVLTNGIPAAGDFMSLREVSRETASRLRIRYGLYAVRPEVHTPRQINDDIADIPIFPNPVPRSSRIGSNSETRVERYNSDLEAASFPGWLPFYSLPPPGQRNAQIARPLSVDGLSGYSLQTLIPMAMGVNKNIEMKVGLISFRYKLIRTTGDNITFFVIPMRYGQRMSPGRREKGSEVRDPDSQGNNKPFRLSFRAQTDNGEWQDGELRFDFSRLGENIFAIFAPRINEGSASVGAGHMVFARVRVFALGL